MTGETLDLFAPPVDLGEAIQHVEESSRERIERRFREFDAENPEVWRLFVRFACEAIAAGRSRFGSQMVIERIRWYTAVETVSSDGLKINNDFARYYAKKFEAHYPAHNGLFEFRDGRVDEGGCK